MSSLATKRRLTHDGEDIAGIRGARVGQTLGGISLSKFLSSRLTNRCWMVMPEIMTQEELETAALTGTLSSIYARLKPDATAIYSIRGDRTFKELNDNINRLARLLRAQGLGPEDGIAIMCGNRAEYVEAFSAAMRIGMRITPVNWHLTSNEVSYIVGDCQAKAFIVDADYADAVADIANSDDVWVKLCMNGSIPGCDDYHSSIMKFPEVEIEDPQHGTFMLYTSGTTGYPKGVWKKKPAHCGVTGSGFFFQTPFGYPVVPDVYSMNVPCCGSSISASGNFMMLE